MAYNFAEGDDIAALAAAVVAMLLIIVAGVAFMVI